MISNSLGRRLGADPGIIGQALTLDGRSYTVTGVMPESFHLPVEGITSAGLRIDVWMPLDPRERAGAAYVAYGRRRPDVTFAAAEADVKRVAAGIAAEDPLSRPAYTARLFDLRETVIRDIRPTLLLLFAAAGLLFLITCANAAGLLLARSVAQARLRSFTPLRLWRQWRSRRLSSRRGGRLGCLRCWRYGTGRSQYGEPHG